MMRRDFTKPWMVCWPIICMKLCRPRRKTLETIDPWEIVPIEVAQDSNIFDSTWVFKTKKIPNGSVCKYKACICVRGDQQQHGHDYFDMYALVVSWNMVRLLLILKAALGFLTKQIDYTLAFVQDKLDPREPPVYVEIPWLFEKPGHILRLKRSLYTLSSHRWTSFTLEARTWS